MLPDDLLFLICEKLRLASDFNTLFNCSLTSKNLAAAALPNLWRIHDTALYSTNGPEEMLDLRKWMVLWKTLILSTFPGRTYTRYLRYIRVLSLRDLELLLEEPEFRNSGKFTFFEGDLAEFYSPFEKVENVPTYRYLEWSSAIKQVAEAIGDRITSTCAELAHASGRTGVLEELDCGEIGPEPIRRFIQRITALRKLRVYQGKSLRGIGPLLHKNCQKFESLTFYDWKDDNAGDDDLAELLRSLRPQTLKSLEIISSSDSKELTAAALSEHNASLTELKFSSAQKVLVASLPLIGPCVRLRTLHLDIGLAQGTYSTDVCDEIGDWMSSCNSLTELTISQLSSQFNTSMLVPLLKSSIALVKLYVRVYLGSTATAFHRALASQRASLQSLTIRGDPDDMEDYILVSSLTELTELRELQIYGLSNNFADEHIIEIATSLPLLEELAITGWNITDAIWPAISSLNLLKKLDMGAYSTFTSNGILDYIETLGEGNQGLALGITMADPQNPLIESEQDLVREALISKVEGRFDYVLGRDPNASDSESDSD